MYLRRILEVLEFLKELLERNTQILEHVGLTVFPNPDKYLSTSEASYLLKKSEKTLYNWGVRGWIAFRKIGGANYYLESDVMMLVNNKGRKA
ncbi:hypothetical protein PBAL39_22535 [Pedobacter sp. BAL39]|uniref:helix-turn-helix domain-containing protein n=1 Tax=Pedobacter sp. BAL39 TaxID=391596 RepID=UPI00015597A6|nr:helix-turn-helix domain-containing protein [Pedobacter sp. BAL39]EDM38898.1 hypothetical protein PBAL39_22535 [Pedobacter sp. BAL39]